MSIENKLKDLISQLEAGYITREEFERLKSRMLDAEQSATGAVDQNFQEYFVESLIGEDRTRVVSNPDPVQPVV